MFLFFLLQHSFNHIYFYIVFIHQFFASANNISGFLIVKITKKLDLVKSFFNFLLLCFSSILYKAWHYLFEMAIGACFGVPPFFSRRKHSTILEVFFKKNLLLFFIRSFNFFGLNMLCMIILKRM